MGVVSGIAGGLIASALCSIALSARRSVDADEGGWRTLRPGIMFHAVLIGTLLLAPVFGWFAINLLRSGGWRDDAWALYGLALASCLALLWVIWTGYLCRTSWNGDQLWVRRPIIGDLRYSFADITGFSSNIDGSALKLRMRDGRKVIVGQYFHGVDELLIAIENREPSQPTIKI